MSYPVETSSVRQSEISESGVSSDVPLPSDAKVQEGQLCLPGGDIRAVEQRSEAQGLDIETGQENVPSAERRDESKCCQSFRTFIEWCTCTNDIHGVDRVISRVMCCGCTCLSLGLSVGMVILFVLLKKASQEGVSDSSFPSH